MEDSRKQFEEWRLSDSPCANLLRDRYGQYAEIGTWVAWRAWQASRAAVEIELPARYEVANMQDVEPDSNGSLLLFDEVVSTIRAAGIRIKGE